MKATVESAQQLKQNLEQSLALLRTLRDELRVEVHLAGMEAKTRWEGLERRFTKAEAMAANVSNASHTIVDEAVTAFRAFREWLADQKKAARPN
ncbi:MAG: hypothetical protein K1X89_07375 [Myxococcaceae bacterium]|nr:hypothetical protein [Myxococcaceae bacterium]